MANSEYLRLERVSDNEIFLIKIGYFSILSRTEYNGTILLKKYGENFHDFISLHLGEKFKIVGTNTILNFSNPEKVYCEITTKNKNGVSFTNYIFIGLNYDDIGSQLCIEEESGSLFAIPYNNMYLSNSVGITVLYYSETSPCKMYMQTFEQGMQGEYSKWNMYISYISDSDYFTPYFTGFTGSYDSFKTGTSKASSSYCALRNYDDDPDTGIPTVDPIYIEYGFPGEPSTPQGGDGDMKDTNEPVPLTPSDVTNVVYPVRCYRLSRNSVSELHSYLWSNDFITNLPKLFSDPFSAIVGIQAIPYISPENAYTIIIGTLDTNILAHRVTDYYVTIDLASIDVTEYWQNFLDYQPYTRLKLFLPYIGIVDLPTDLFMNNSVAVKYRIDIVSGACVAVVSNSENIICTFTGNCSTKIPLSNNDHSNAIGNTLVGIAGLAGSVATGNAVGAVANTASIVAGLKERIQISGSLSTAHGILINDKPFLMIERPDTEIPENYASLKGYTSNISMKLSETTGFTKISDIKLDGLSCTDAEKEELLNMMQNGIYL